MVAVAGRGRESGHRTAGRQVAIRIVVMQMQHRRLAFSITRTRARMPLDHTARCQVSFDPVAHREDIMVILEYKVDDNEMKQVLVHIP